MRRAALSLLAASLLAQAPDPRRTPDAVAAAERAFAARAAEVGTPAAFLAFLAEDAVVFTPEPTNGPAAQRAKPEDGSRLAWGPEHVELAASGDFALSTGAWTWTPKGAAAPAVHGHFLSLWVLRPEGWRVRLDVGVPHPPQAAQPLVARASAAPADPDARAVLTAAWKAFDAAAARDLGAALKSYGAADLRRYRPGRPVEPGGPGDPAPGTPWTEAGAHVAPSADLALRWGRRGKGAVAVQAWRREGMVWRVALDVELPKP